MGSTAGPKERGEQREMILPYSGSGPDNIKKQAQWSRNAPLRLFFKKEKEERRRGKGLGET